LIVDIFLCRKKYAMARRTIEMEVKKQIGILQSLGYGKKTIARELGLSKNTVKSYLEETGVKDGDPSVQPQ
jgi:DNA-binding NarL/FixJ family response regulator